MPYTYTVVTNDNGTETINALDETTGSFLSIPTDPANSDYQTYLRWVENPNAPEFQTPWVEPQLTK